MADKQKSEELANQIIEESNEESMERNEGLEQKQPSVEQSKKLPHQELQERYEKTVHRVRNLKQGLDIHKKRASTLRKKLNEDRSSYYGNRYNRKDKVSNLKLDNKSKKAEMKATRKFSISGFEKRRRLRHEIRKNKLSIKRQKLAMKREKREIRAQNKQYRKERLNVFKQRLKQTTTKVKAIYQGRRAERANASFEAQKRSNNNVISLEDFKVKKKKLTLDKKSIKDLKAKRSLNQKKDATLNSSR